MCLPAGSLHLSVSHTFNDHFRLILAQLTVASVSFQLDCGRVGKMKQKAGAWANVTELIAAFPHWGTEAIFHTHL